MIDNNNHLSKEVAKLEAAGWELLLTDSSEGRGGGDYTAFFGFPGGQLLGIIAVGVAGELPPVVNKVFLEVATVEQALKLAREV